ncbi:hypothetical protein [Azospirillum sp. sgz302134]
MSTLQVTEDADGKLELAVKKTPGEQLEQAFGKAGPNLSIFNEIVSDKMRHETAEAADKMGQPQDREQRRTAAMERFTAKRAAERQQGAEIG